MSKRLKNLLIAGSVLLVLVAAVVVLLLLPPAEEPKDNTDNDKDESVVLLEKDEKITVSSIDVTYDGEDFRLYADKDGQWLIDGYEDLPVDATAVENVVEYMLKFEVDKQVVESTDSPADFGLEKPAATYTATYSDDSTHMWYIGDKEPGGDGYYLQQQEDEAIYLIGTYKGGLLLSDVRNYVDTILVTTPSINEDDENGASTIVKAELSGRVRDQAITLHSITTDTADEFPYFGYYISKPYRVGVSTASDLETTIGELRTVDALAAEVLHPTDKQIEKYGLDDPYSRLTIDLAIETYEEDEDGNRTYSTYNPQSYDVRFSEKQKDGYYYAIRSDVDAIYQVSADAVPWIAYEYDDIASDVLFMRDITTIDTIVFELNGETYDVDLTHIEDAAEGEANMTVQVNGKTADVMQLRRLYQVMMDIPRSGAAESVSGDAFFTIELIDLDGKTVERAKFYKRSASTYACEQLNGEVYAVASSSVENLIEQFERYLDGKVVTVTG